MLPIPNADLKRFYEQGLAEFITGKRELTKANWDAWIAEFKKQGGQAWNDAGVQYAQDNDLLV
jgi:putative aldouronate transport system substrate-binding protein